MGTPPQNQSGMGNEKYKKASISSHFWIGKFEVTQEQWQAVMGNNPSKVKAFGHPVESVGYEQSLEFCEKLNKLYADKLPAGYWAHLDVMEEGFRSKRDEKIIAIFEYQ